VIVGDFDADPLVAAWLQRAAPYGIRSSANIPCRSNGRVVGVLIVHASEPHAFGADELALFERLADEIAFAVALEEERDRLRAAKENLRAAAELGPGLLYRANVGADGFTVKSTFGNASRIAQVVPDHADGSQAVASLMNASEQRAAIEALSIDAHYSHDLPVVSPDGVARWLRNDVRVTGRSGQTVDVIGYLTEITLEKQQHLHSQQIDTLLTLGEMATSMAHEVSQPLASISFAAQNAGRLLRRNPSDLEAIAGKLDKIVGETQRTGRLIDHMRVFARNEHTAKAPVAWRDVLASALELMTWQTASCRIVDAISPDLPKVMGESIPMEQVLINLISNAIDAYRNGPQATPVVVRVEGFVQEGMVVLRVADQAGGFPPHVLPRVFEPFFTTKPPGKGTGLGMAIVFGTIVELGGSVTAANEDGGAVVEIRLPPAPGV
jgi:signal transduction histidine kinase